MKRHEILAALAAAAGLSLASPAQAGIASNVTLSAPAAETLAHLQQRLDSDEALSQMIQLAKAQGHDRAGTNNGKGNKGGVEGNKGQHKGIGGGVGGGKGHDSTPGKGKGKGHGKGQGHGGGHGKGHGKGHHHPS